MIVPTLGNVFIKISGDKFQDLVSWIHSRSYRDKCPRVGCVSRIDTTPAVGRYYLSHAARIRGYTREASTTGAAACSCLYRQHLLWPGPPPPLLVLMTFGSLLDPRRSKLSLGPPRNPFAVTHLHLPRRHKISNVPPRIETPECLPKY